MANWTGVLWPAWQSQVLNTYAKKVVQYEGGYSSYPMSSIGFNYLGLDNGNTVHYDGMVSLFGAYQDSDLFRQAQNDHMRNFMAALTTAQAPAWLLMSTQASSPPPTTEWVIYKTDIYGATYKSYDAISNFNAVP